MSGGQKRGGGLGAPGPCACRRGRVDAFFSLVAGTARMSAAAAPARESMTAPRADQVAARACTRRRCFFTPTVDTDLCVPLLLCLFSCCALIQVEMPGLMSARAEYGPTQPLAGARIEVDGFECATGLAVPPAGGVIDVPCAAAGKELRITVLSPLLRESVKHLAYFLCVLYLIPKMSEQQTFRNPASGGALDRNH